MLVRREPPTTSESTKNASGQVAFGSKGKEALVEQSPVVSTVDVTSADAGAGEEAVSTTEKDKTSTALPAGDEQDDLCIADPQPTLDLQTTEAGGANVEHDDCQCLYVETPWENNVIADRRDIDEFKEASRTIRWTLAVRTWALILQSLSLMPIELRLRQAYTRSRPMPTQKLPRLKRLLCMQRSRLRRRSST
jgi:hypothetical protein